MTRTAYLIAELKCAAMRARLMQLDIEAIELAVMGGLVTPDQAVKLLDECDCLKLVGAVRKEAPT
jgi:hypothetical protein